MHRIFKNTFIVFSYATDFKYKINIIILIRKSYFSFQKFFPIIVSYHTP